jgi:exonuclease SbcD
VKLAHLADLHLGFRAFDRTNASGQNQREADVALALRRAVDDLLGVQPDVVVIAGDVFHQVKPSNSATLYLFQQLQRLRGGLPGTPIVMIAGDHDTPRSSAETFLLPLYQALGVLVATSTAAQLQDVVPGVTVTAVPRAAVTRIPEPRAGALNVLVVHGDVPGYGDPHPQWKIDPAVLEDLRWEYIALGHYHVSVKVGPRAWYAGALDYTTTDAWGEVRKHRELGLAGKGYLVVDLPGGQPSFRPLLEPPRHYDDLESIDATGMDAPTLDAAIASRLCDYPLAGAVVRLVVHEVHKEVRHQLNHAQLRAWRHQALHFQLELERPVTEGTPETRARMHQNIEERTREFLGARAIAPGLDRQQFVETGMQYVKDAQ